MTGSTQALLAAASVESSEFQFRQFVEGLPAAGYMCDPEGRITMFNAAAIELWGRTPELGVDMWCGSLRVYRPDGRLMLLEDCPMAVTLRECRAVRGEEIIIERPDGSRRHALPYPQPIFDASGVLVGAFNMLVDITEQANATARLAAAREETTLQLKALSRLHDLAMRLAGTSEPQPALQAVLETLVNVHHGDFGLIALHDANTGCRTVGASLGFDDETLDRLTRIARLPDEDGNESFSTVKSRVVIEDIELDSRDVRYREIARAAGFRAVHSTPISTRSGETLGVLTVYFRTRRRPTESEIQLANVCALHAADAIEAAKARQALQESEQRFRNMADHAPVMIWVTEADGRCTFLGKSWYEFTGRTPESAMGFGWIEAMHPDDRLTARDRFLAASDDHLPFRQEYRLLGNDGQYHWVIDAAVPRFGEDGAFLGYIGSVIDISERKKMEEALRDSQTALVEADHRKDEFLAMLAHELRNPLAPIRTGLELMRLAGDDRNVLDEVRTTMDRQTQQMVRLIDDLLDVSRITRGRVELRKCRVELASVVESAVETALPVIEELQHDLHVDLPERPIVLDADPTRLAQVIANLLNNAAKYMERGGLIELQAERDGGEVAISIKDAGIGIPAEMLSRIFELFTQVDGSIERSHGGLGIGLTLVKRLVEMHGGTVTARSEGPGHGSEFIVRLPIVVGLLPGSAGGLGEQVAAPGTRRIIIVDDNENAAQMLAMLLRALGNDVRTAYDGFTALELGAEFRPDVMLLDIGMPKMDGYETARRIRKQPWGVVTTLAAVTGWSQESDKRRTRLAGFDHHFVKPIELSSLQSFLAECGANGV